MATMEDQAFEAGPRKNRGGSTRSLERQRQRAEELLAAQKARLERVAAEIAAQLEARVCPALAEIDPALDIAGAELQEKAAALGRQTEQLERAQCELAENERRWADERRAATDQIDRQRADLQQRQAEAEALTAKLGATERELKRAQQDHGLNAEQLARRESRCVDLEKRLAYEHDQLELLREQTKTQRRRIAQELKAERAAQQRELERLRHDVDLLQAGQRQSFDQASKQIQRERAELQASLDGQRQEIRRQQADLAEQEAALNAAQNQCELRERKSAEQQSEEADRLRRDIAALTLQLESARPRSPSRPPNWPSCKRPTTP